MHILNIARAIKKMTVKELKDFTFENYHQRMGFAKENSYYSMKHHRKRSTTACNQINRKIPGPCNAKEHYQSFLRKNPAKPAK